MFTKSQKTVKPKLDYYHDIVGRGTVRLMLFASAVIALAVLVTGIVSYTITEKAIVNKLKSSDLRYIAQSIIAKIDGRIARGKETASILARDPDVLQWVMGGEKDTVLGSHAMEQITGIARDYDYDNSFIVSAITNHYWAEGGKLIDTMSKNDPDDSWFYETLAAKEPISIVIDYNNERKGTFVFINALMGPSTNPVAVTGVGLNLADIAKEFEGYKFGLKSNMWLVDRRGDIYISEDIEQTGKNITGFLPKTIGDKVTGSGKKEEGTSKVLEYKNNAGEVFDLIYQSIPDTDWKLVLQIPRSESTAMVESLKVNTVIGCLITLVFAMLLFYLVSRRIADPYKRAVLLSQELEKQVEDRTKELNEKNEKIMDSIEYAKLIQEAVLPPADELSRIWKNYFILWSPRDVVGGDFYFTKRVEDGYMVVVGDCTGHGVPGALMTMSVHSILDHVLDTVPSKNPAEVLKQVNRRLKTTLGGRQVHNGIDDGLDAGVIYIPDHGELLFAGAKITLYAMGTDGLHTAKGDLRGLGYRNTGDEFTFTCHSIARDEGSTFYLTTDGYVDQNGGEKNFSFGRSRFEAILCRHGEKPLERQKEIFEEELKAYMGEESQRDDITVIGFKLHRERQNGNIPVC